jgi:hypothetical protein
MLSVATVAASKVSTANSQSTAINATPSERPVLRLRIMALFALPPHPLPLLPSPAWKASAFYLPPALATAVPSGAGPWLTAQILHGILGLVARADNVRRDEHDQFCTYRVVIVWSEQTTEQWDPSQKGNAWAASGGGILNQAAKGDGFAIPDRHNAGKFSLLEQIEQNDRV